jgi:uncharacterized Ntn-hydrolase superfamily protein
MTFSIVACDLRTEEWGVAVASKFIAVGAVVPWLQAGVGAVATQALANTSYGPHALSLLASGMSAREALDRLIAADSGRAERQVGVIDGRGRAATHTGDECMPWAGGRTGRGYAAQGNILAGPGVVDAMADACEHAPPGPLAERLLAALAAGDGAGGDRRGKQSAALRVASPRAGYGGFNDVKVDLRVDDHAEPVLELQRLYRLHDLLFGRTPDEDQLEVTDAVEAELRDLLGRVGHPAAAGRDGLHAAMRAWVGAENLEERWIGNSRLDPVILERLREVAGAEGQPA